MRANFFLLLLTGLTALTSASPWASSSAAAKPTKITATTHTLTSLSLLTKTHTPKVHTPIIDTTTTLTPLSLANTTAPTYSYPSGFTPPSTVTPTLTPGPTTFSQISLLPHEVPPFLPGIPPLSQMAAWNRMHISSKEGDVFKGGMVTKWDFPTGGEEMPDCSVGKHRTGWVGWCTKPTTHHKGH